VPDLVIDALVLHSPLVGPSTVRPLAQSLEALGYSTSVPDLRDALTSPDEYTAAAGRHVGTVDVLVGHSGAGAFLPQIAASTEATATVFIDALVPGTGDAYIPSGRFVEFVDSLPVTDGRLPPWHEWWPADTLARLLPDESQRSDIVAENPRVPRTFYDASVSLPDMWWTRPAAYLQLSPAYDDDRDRAERWGWPTRQLAGHHLDLVTRPEAIAEVVVDLIGQALVSTRRSR
jgi:hypothetical protein